MKPQSAQAGGVMVGPFGFFYAPIFPDDAEIPGRGKRKPEVSPPFVFIPSPPRPNIDKWDEIFFGMGGFNF